jgi:hypothetical protein
MNKNDWQIGDLKNIPLEIIAKMLERQEEQGFGRNLEILQENRNSSVGFRWQNTVEGYDFWSNILSHGEYYLFFQKYPKNKIYELWA